MGRGAWHSSSAHGHATGIRVADGVESGTAAQDPRGGDSAYSRFSMI